MSVFHAEGTVLSLSLPRTASSRACPSSCAEGGVLGILPGTIGTLQATEALKVLLGIGEPLIGKLLLYNALNMTFDFVKLRKT